METAESPWASANLQAARVVHIIRDRAVPQRPVVITESQCTDCIAVYGWLSGVETRLQYDPSQDMHAVDGIKATAKGARPPTGYCSLAVYADMCTMLRQRAMATKSNGCCLAKSLACKWVTAA